MRLDDCRAAPFARPRHRAEPVGKADQDVAIGRDMDVIELDSWAEQLSAVLDDAIEVLPVRLAQARELHRRAIVGRCESTLNRLERAVDAWARKSDNLTRNYLAPRHTARDVPPEYPEAR